MILEKMTYPPMGHNVRTFDNRQIKIDESQQPQPSFIPILQRMCLGNDIFRLTEAEIFFIVGSAEIRYETKITD